MSAPTTFPVQRTPGRGVTGLLFVPWHIGAEAWEKYRGKYGNDQSAERIAQRGGFGEEEMDEFRPGWREFIIGGEQS